MAWIAIDSFVAIAFPTKLGLISTKTRTMAIVFTWCSAGLFNFPKLITCAFVQHGNTTYCENSKSALTNQDATYIYFWLEFIFSIFAPLLTITVLYTAIAFSLKRQSEALADTAKNVERHHCLKKRRQAIQMAVVIVVLFYICFIPQTLQYFLHYWRCSCDFMRLFIFIADFSFMSSSTVNAIFCLSLIETHRRGLRSILCACRTIGCQNESK